MNLFKPKWDAEVANASGEILRAVRLGAHAGARCLAANLYEMESGVEVSPLHCHHANEELLLVLSGTPTLRRGVGQEETLEPGAVVAFPVGPEGAHQVVNRSRAMARVLIVATAALPEVAEQPEEGRLAIITTDGLRIVPRADLVQAP